MTLSTESPAAPDGAPERLRASAAARNQVRAVEYRRLASAANASGEASQLDNVRQKHAVAAARWTALADMADASGWPGPDLTLMPGGPGLAPAG